MFNQAAATGGDARQLVGYLVSESGLPLDTAALKAQLAKQLPPHMVPVVLLQISCAAVKRQRQAGSQGAAAAGADQQNFRSRT
ncbi:hypothetical protein ACVT18_20950 [Klebsiella pneumoniae]